MRHHRHFHWLRTFTTFTFLLFSSVLAITTLTPQPSGGAVKHLNREENLNGSPALPVKRSVEEEKRFGGPGSSPPSCRSKCGWCNPCIPVHVPVQPGLIIRLEYYPEAWRCNIDFWVNLLREGGRDSQEGSVGNVGCSVKLWNWKEEKRELGNSPQKMQYTHEGVKAPFSAIGLNRDTQLLWLATPVVSVACIN
ncbi:unnamed protein product [Sphenostylis stenocarpa]|uniref:Epidermal patterning factor-like protein n=1 Tax=Sphenostylis stenocarpa TaxID=92480 RepID=A0AA87B7E6_9FABA|nr:unnamed protein product [Sphenostylis stenocarpa]